jgi:hypothetical protein
VAPKRQGLALAHVAGWQVLQLYVPPIYATLILLGVDVVIAAIFGGSARSRAIGPCSDGNPLGNRRRGQEQDGWVLPTLAPAGSWSDGNDLGIGAVARSGMDAVHWVRLDSRFGTDRSHRAGIPPISLPRLR